MYRTLAAVALLSAALAAAQQLPAGTRSADSPENNSQIQTAETALEHGDYVAAIAALKPLAASQPHNAHVLYDLGFAQEHAGDDAAAAAAYSESIAADDALPEPRLALGLLDARTGKLDAAHTELQAASTLAGAPPQLRARALRALATLDETANPDAARDELLAAVKLTAETPADVLLSARLAEHAGAMPEAEGAYRHLLQLEPDNLDAIVGLAHTLEEQHKDAEAETTLNEALKTHANEPRLISQLAAVYAAEGKTAEAIPLVERLRSADPSAAANPQISRLLAHLYLVNGEPAKAEPLYSQLAAATPADPTLLDDLGSTLVVDQKYAEAETVLAKAVAMRSSFPSESDWAETASHLAFAASKNHDPRAALQALAARATVLPNSPASLFLEATAHDSLHQNKDAERAYRAFLAIAAGKFPDQEFQARHRLIALEHER